jgi:putative Holliday junction resolvase
MPSLIKKVLAIDPGSRRVGVAVSDPGGTVALPLTVLETSEPLDQLVQLIQEQSASEVVVGLPISLDGTEGPAASSVRELASELSNRVEVPVRLVDERLTTAAAGKALSELDMSERRRRKVVDKVAATLLLQSYLDSRAG